MRTSLIAAHFHLGRSWLIAAGFLLALSVPDLQAQRPSTPPARPGAAAASPVRIGEIRLVAYNVGHELADSSGAVRPPYPSPLQGFLENENWGYVGRGSYTVPLVVMVEVLGTPPAPGDARSLTLALAASQQFAGEGPKTRVAGPEPVELSSVWATANPPESGEIPTKLGRTWLPFVYYVRTDCISYEFTASVRAGATGPALSQQSAKFFVPFECH